MYFISHYFYYKFEFQTKKLLCLCYTLTIVTVLWNKRSELSWVVQARAGPFLELLWVNKSNCRITRQHFSFSQWKWAEYFENCSRKNLNWDSQFFQSNHLAHHWDLFLFCSLSIFQIFEDQPTVRNLSYFNKLKRSS